VEKTESADETAYPAHRIRMPGFIVDDEVGLGDVIKRATSYFGLSPCGGCKRRASALNRWLVLTRRPGRRRTIWPLKQR